MFGRRIRLFRILGFPIGIDLSWFPVFALVTWSLAAGVFPRTAAELGTAAHWIMGVVAALGLFASVVLHELGHAVIARREGMPMRGITLFIFGGVAEMQGQPPGPGAEFRVAIAGPIASVCLGGILLAIGGAGEALAWPVAVNEVVAYVGLINLVLVVFNLLPAFPLDGGRVLRSALWRWKGELRRATRIATGIGSGFGLGFIALGVLSALQGALVGGVWWVLIGLFLRSAAQMSYQQVLVRHSLEGEPVRRFMSAAPRTVAAGITVAELVDEHVLRYHHRVFPVVEEDGSLLGTVTTDSIRDVERAAWLETRVADIVQPMSEADTIGPDEDALRALERMSRDRREHLFVVENGWLDGILALNDLTRFVSLRAELDDGNGSALPVARPASGRNSGGMVPAWSGSSHSR